MSPFGKDLPLSLGDLQQGINNLFDQVWHSGIRTPPLDGQDWSPLIEVIDKNDRFVIQVELPGMMVEDVDVTCCGNQIVIRGQKTQTDVDEEQDHRVVAERRYGSFGRTIALPEAVKSTVLAAKFNQGVLHIEAPKQEVTHEKQIKIEIEE